MTHATQAFIAVCWGAWLLYWLLAAFSTKRTAERGGWLGYRLVTVLLVIGLLALARSVDVSREAWHTPGALALVCALMVLAGLAFTVWARVELGRNWSAEVTFKQDHELIETGPYALVRHPIYTGLITMGLFTALDLGGVFGLVLWVGLCGGLWVKAHEEERVMSAHFPEQYADYRRRVHAIVPFVL